MEQANPEEKSDDTKDELKNSDILIVQDMGFSIKIQAPGIDTFELQVQLVATLQPAIAVDITTNISQSQFL